MAMKACEILELNGNVLQVRKGEMNIGINDAGCLNCFKQVTKSLKRKLDEED